MTAGDFIHQYNYEMFVLNHGVICTMKLQSYKTKTRGNIFPLESAIYAYVAVYLFSEELPYTPCTF